MNQADSTGTPKQLARALRIVTATLIGGTVMFALAMILVVHVIGSHFTPEEKIKAGSIVLYIVYGITVACAFLSKYQYQKKIINVKNGTGSISSKINEYRPVLVSYMALCEGPAMLAVIAFFMTGNYILLGAVPVMVLHMLLMFPVKKNLVRELSLDWQQEQEL